MPMIQLRGVRGGVGVSSVASALAYALNQLGESVLLIDASSHNTLGLHFNAGVDTQAGWAYALIQQQPWHQMAFQYRPNLTYVPFGDLNRSEIAQVSEFLAADRHWWQAEIKQISNASYRWILFDCATETDQIYFSLKSDLNLCLLNADAACYALLHQKMRDQSMTGSDLDKTYFLINQFLPKSHLQQDLQQLWQQTLPSLIPITLHQDESMAESLAQKQPLGEYAPYSLSAEEINTLANWCLLHVSALS